MSEPNYELTEDYPCTNPDPEHDLGAGLRRHFPELDSWLWSNAGRDGIPAAAVLALVLGALLFGVAL